ncbi:hypothetical protein SARC_07243 [Sphaeroforma arctica JP610]|uniref:GT23 domain-containing protein n=1 Tax=Sphaeroforma arctica JP610 TaxID=667725 RepID=A0A0L0FU75_9EUKA|nr:hypothetical protein SARC_07243 [Sphaeroforma arctica JP610]KNC80400.1 hypothetical protein SARC_07243 [Sphaeroforma arctica JP610]|eukprot:XP_014154302.1 hypothetical protein SARC_07243 [Sphaeroforma arctica JP610]
MMRVFFKIKMIVQSSRKLLLRNKHKTTVAVFRHFRDARTGQYIYKILIAAACFLVVCSTLNPDILTTLGYYPTYINTGDAPTLKPESTQKWVESCRKLVLNADRACLNQHGFWDHYTVLEAGEDVSITARNAACRAAATIFKHQMCDLDCSKGWYFSVLNTGTGTGSRWHTYTRGILRALETDQFIRLWEGAGPFHFFTTDTCPEGSEGCYFSRSDRCITYDSKDNINNTHTDISTQQVTWNYQPPQSVSKRSLTKELGQSYMWLTSQVMFFLLQPLPFVSSWVDEFWRGDSQWRLSTGKISRHEPYITMHVRWGDKCGWGKEQGKEAQCVPFAKYMQAAENLRERNPDLKHIILSTEDSRALETLGDYTHRWIFSYTKTDRKGAELQSMMRSGNATDFQAHEVKNSLINFYLSAYAHAAVYTASSNWSRAFLRFSRALRGRIIDSVSMDDWDKDLVLEGIPSRLLAEINGRLGPEGERYCFDTREKCPPDLIEALR